MLDVEGFILVGGASSRMGSDKSLLVIKGQTTVERIVATLRPIAQRISLVGFQGNNDSVLPNIPDLHQRWGPLAGIQAALHACNAELCIVVACDLPFVTTALFQYLLGAIQTPECPDAVVPVQSDGHVQPLCALYKREPCLIAANRSIANGDHAPLAMFDKLKTRFISFDEIAALSGAEHFFLNLNRPEDYERANRIAAP